MLSMCVQFAVGFCDWMGETVLGVFDGVERFSIAVNLSIIF